MKANLEVQIGALKFKNPVLTASGTFGYGKIMGRIIDISSLGGIITKSITTKPKEGNPAPRIVETPCGMLNSIGLENKGLENFLTEVLPEIQKFKTNKIASIAGESVDEYKILSETLDGKVDALEVNISCPNVRNGGMSFGQDMDSVKNITRAVRENTSLPVIVKLTPNVTNIKGIAKICENSGADAISLVNTYKGLSIDTDGKVSKLGSFSGGLSGPAIKPLALYAVSEVYSEVTIPVIGCGGIMDASDAIEFIMAGATLIEVGSATFRDPMAAIKIVQGLKIYSDKEKMNKIMEIRGIVNEN